jgi:hypothetical protein
MYIIDSSFVAQSISHAQDTQGGFRFNLDASEIFSYPGYYILKGLENLEESSVISN